MSDKVCWAVSCYRPHLIVALDLHTCAAALQGLALEHTAVQSNTCGRAKHTQHTQQFRTPAQYLLEFCGLSQVGFAVAVVMLPSPINFCSDGVQAQPAAINLMGGTQLLTAYLPGGSLGTCLQTGLHTRKHHSAQSWLMSPAERVQQ